jgi:hypothetical protein
MGIKQLFNDVRDGFIEAVDYFYIEDGIAAYVNGDFPKAYHLLKDYHTQQPIALFLYACMLFAGRGTIADTEKATALFTKAAPYIPNAILILGYICKDGTKEVAPNPIEALKWFLIFNIMDTEFSENEILELKKQLPASDVLTAERLAREWVNNNPDWDRHIEYLEVKETSLKDHNASCINRANSKEK